MNNLIEQSAVLLRSKECLEGTIFSRTRNGGTPLTTGTIRW